MVTDGQEGDAPAKSRGASRSAEPVVLAETSKSRLKRTKPTKDALQPDDSVGAGTKSPQKRPAPIAEDEPRSTKKVKTVLPLQDHEETEPLEVMAKGSGAASKKPATVDARGQKRCVSLFSCLAGELILSLSSQRITRQQKENTPVSDTEGKSLKPRARSKPRSAGRGPRKSVMVRMKEPLPPVEDEDDDPINFLS